MDSRKCSAALGFTLLIGCVIGIVILIYNSGSTRRSSETSTSSSSIQHNHKSHHHHRASSTTIVGGKSGGDHFVSLPKDGFDSDPNYRSSQPTMQEVNELADELRLLSSKSKHVLGSSSINSKGNPVNSGTVTSMKKTNGSMATSSSSATSSAKATISAVNYISVPKKGSFVPPAGSVVPPPGSPVSDESSLVPDFSQSHRNHPLASAPVIRQEAPMNQPHDHDLQQKYHNNQVAYPGHPSQSSPVLPPPSPTKAQPKVDSRERHKVVPPHDNMGRGGGDVGLPQNDLYMTSWHPSMVSPAGGGIAVASTNHSHHPPQLHTRSNNINPQQTRASSSVSKVSKPGKGTGYPLNQIQKQVPNPKQYQHGYHHQPQDQKKEETEQEHTDFVEVDDDYEDDLSANQGNVKKEEEWDDDDTADDDNEEYDEEEEEEEDVDDNGANPGALAEPKNLAADLETLFSLANHLYTSPASILSAFSQAQAKTNSTKKTNSATPMAGLPTAFQGFLKVVNETIQRGNNSKLLVELNEMYRGREARMSGTSSDDENNNNTNNTTKTTSLATTAKDSAKNSVEDKSESPYEKGLTAFVFMSFGVFLLNQIHSFVQKAADEHLKHHNLISNNTVVGEARALHWDEGEGPFSWYSPRGPMLLTSESSSLDILFQPPVPPNTTFTSNSSEFASGRSSDMEATTSAEGHVNNMFRALLNIGNAYAQDSPELECIWSLYCQDLDKTAQKQGLYGVAARINSVGLRLIMKQIPPALTFDVILRSLVGWDGLPCRKMFPECSVHNGTISRTSDKGETTNAL